jgi:hypothetical protein
MHVIKDFVSWIYSWSWNRKSTSLHMLSDAHICRQKILGVVLIRYCNEWVQYLVAKARLEKDQLTSQGFCRSTEAMRKHGGLVNSALGFFPVSTPCSLKHVWVHIEQALNRGLISTLTIIFYTPVIFWNCRPASEESSKQSAVHWCALCSCQCYIIHWVTQTTNNKP